MILKTKTKLLNHQIEAYEKLKKIKVGALYMEMGTGKTRTALELIADRMHRGKIDYVLWLCPYSIKRDILRDINKHVVGLDDTNLKIVGIETLSSSIKANEMLRDLVLKKKVYLIVDESYLVKNYFRKRTRNIIELAEKCQYKLILNGTPIGKTESDLFSQWMVLDWRILGYKSFYSFEANHLEYDERIPGKVVRALNVDYLMRKIAPYSFQALKSECLMLPPKTYGDYAYSLTEDQEFHYDMMANELLFQVDELKPETIYRMFSALQLIISGRRVQDVKGHLRCENMFQSPEENPRVQRLLDIIERIGDEKIIIYCKYTREIDELEMVLDKRFGEGNSVKYYGVYKEKERIESQMRFEKYARFFLANKGCAKYGLNLQYCSHVIYYSNDWDYVARAQSEDRVHRIGQNNNVHIIDLYAAGTLDQRIMKCLNRKESMINEFRNQLKKERDSKSLLKWIHGGTEEIDD